nr:hypothetical protein B0A51_06503 [Rachicladosporium sp. CCFEE 5018]
MPPPRNPAGMATTAANTMGAVNRITREMANIQTSGDLSLAAACRDTDVRKMRAMIIGPPETPYEFGFYEFEIHFPKAYPIEPPTVTCITTNGGKCRFNPNIYAQGKVCLSILGTWRGEEGEQWSSAQGLESVLLSIQSLMSSNPYENEPGFERTKLEDNDAAAYAQKIRHESLRIAVITRLEQFLGIDTRESEDPETPPVPETTCGSADVFGENDVATPATEPSVYEYDAESSYRALDLTPWDPFPDLLKRRFLWYYDAYIATIDKASKEQKDGKAFALTRFEDLHNGMAGTYQYLNLRARLDRIRRSLASECDAWKLAGAKQVTDSTQLATQLAFQFKQLSYKWNDSTYAGCRLEISLQDPSNPFVWHLTLFGEPSTNLDGGVFNLSFTVPPNFPEAWPRVYIETPMYHHRISASTGTLCYFPVKEDEIGSHLEGIVKAIEDKDPRFDPRIMVNPDASALYWGGEEKRKIYYRKVRRSAQDSMGC